LTFGIVTEKSQNFLVAESVESAEIY